MCRSIQPLHNYEPPSSADDVSAAALQYVRKISGTTKPPRINQAAFDRAVEAVAAAASPFRAQTATAAPAVATG